MVQHTMMQLNMDDDGALTFDWKEVLRQMKNHEMKMPKPI